MWWLRRAVGVAFVLALGGLLFFLGAGWAIRRSAQPYLYTDLSRVPPRPVAVVFGALVYPSGYPSPVLQARIRTAVEMYRAGKVKKLLMTGDNGDVHYDEVTAMKQAAVRLGVPARDIVRDYAGFRTYDSCYRARAVFDVDRAILVTQGFHLPRAVCLARHLGIDAVGLVAPDDLDDATLDRLRWRERLAQAAAVVNLVLHHKPKFLGPREPLFVNQRDDR